MTAAFRGVGTTDPRVSGVFALDAFCLGRTLACPLVGPHCTITIKSVILITEYAGGPWMNT